jgi:hypothetical protein
MPPERVLVQVPLPPCPAQSLTEIRFAYVMKSRFMDAKWVANLELSDFLTTFRREIEHVRCSTPGPVPSEYDPILDEVNEAHQPLLVHQRDSA